MCRQVKEKGTYFKDEIFVETVIPFSKNPQNVLNVKETTILHDKAPCMKKIATHQLVRSNSINFFDNNQWPGYAPHLNVCENREAIMKDRVGVPVE